MNWLGPFNTIFLTLSAYKSIRVVLLTLHHTYSVLIFYIGSFLYCLHNLDRFKLQR